jgi:hypothetical protein
MHIGMALVGAVLGSVAAITTPAGAQDCHDASIPGSKLLTLRHAGGDVVSLRRGTHNHRPVAQVWINGGYTGQHEIPFSLAGGDIQVLLRMQQRLETWLGKVRQVSKPIPYVIACGSWVDVTE